jgi:hypothetical protein
MDEQLSNQAKEQTSEKVSASTIVEKINQGRPALGCTSKVENPESKNIGNNGYSIGSVYTLTGEINLLVPVRINNAVASTYIGLETEEGTTLNLAQIMGISSLSGYSIDSNQEFVQQSFDDDSKLVETKFHPDVTPNVTANSIEKVLFKPQSRNLYEEAAILMNNPELIKGKKVYFIGTAYRGFVAKKNNSIMNYQKGHQRVIAQKLWGFEAMPQKIETAESK